MKFEKLSLALMLCFTSFYALADNQSKQDKTDINDGKTHVQNGVSDPKSYYSRKAEGWFFYNEKEQPKKEELEETKPDLSPTPQEPPKDLKPQKIDPEKVPFSAAWFRKNMQHYLDLAIDQPTEKNVKTFFYLQRIMLDKANKFADVSQTVILGNPLLDANSKRPISTWGGNVVNTQSRHAKKELLKQLKDKISLVYLFKGEDPYSTSFSPIVKMYQDKYGIYIKAVTVDGKADLSNSFPKAKYEPKAGKAFNVTFYPALYLYTQKGDLISLCQGLLSNAELTDRILMFAHKTGMISDEEYDTTKKYFNNNNLSEIADELRTELSTDENGLFTPDELITLFEGK